MKDKLKEFDNDLRDIYTLTLKIQAKVYDLMRKIEEAKEKINEIKK